MQPTREMKLRASAEHLLDLFLGLRSKYAILHPLIVEPDVARRWGDGARGRGLAIIRDVLFTSCVIDVCKITLDKDRRSPSLAKLVDALSDEHLLGLLRERAATPDLLPLAVLSEDVSEFIATAKTRNAAGRRARFNATVDDLLRHWEELSASPVLAACVTLRNKLLAHSDLHHDGRQYRALDVGALGLKWGDLGPLIAQVQPIVELASNVYRDASFGWDSLDRQLADAAASFWRAHRDA
jgi:hypothetical protein